MSENVEQYLTPTFFIDFDNPAVQAFAEENSGDAETDLEKAINLYYAVRDGIRYNPYSASMEKECMTASFCLEKREAFCIPKAILLTASARAIGIPARLAFGDVRNHLTSDRLREAMEGSDLFPFHGQTEMYLDGQWVKCTPAFNKELCAKTNTHPLEWDGKHDSVFQSFDKAGNKYMEYVKDRGSYADMPYDEFIQVSHENMANRHNEHEHLEDSEKLTADDFENEAYAGDRPN